MTTMNEMKDVLKEQLEKDGSLNEVRAKLRSHLFNTLNNNQKSKQNLSNQDLIMGELIREYLTFRNLNYANSVMIPEAGLPERPLDRGIIANQLNVEESSETRQLPLLYSLVFGLKSRVEEYDVPSKHRSNDPEYGHNIFSVEQSKGFEVKKGK